MKKRFVCVVIAMALLLRAFYLFDEMRVNASELKNIEQIKSGIQKVEAEKELLIKDEKYNKACNNFDSLMNKICAKGELPNYYGGAYIKDDKELVVLLTEKSESNIRKIKEATGNDSITVEFAKLSLNDLLELQKEYDDIYVNNYSIKDKLTDAEKKLMDDLQGTYVVQSSNSLVVKIMGITDEKIKLHKKLFGENENIKYEDCGRNVSTLEWRPGREMYTSAWDMSTGFRAYYIDSNGIRHDGFVTAGHTCNTNNVVYREASRMPISILGQCKVSRVSGKVDAAFIAVTDSNYTVSNTCFYPNDEQHILQSTSYVTSLAEKEWIYKTGAETYSTVGRVISISESFYYNGITITDLYKSETLCMTGDSGGCAYVYRNGKYYVIGIIKGAEFQGLGEPSIATFDSCYITKIKNIISALGITKY